MNQTNRKLTGRYIFKKKYSGMVLFVEYNYKDVSQYGKDVDVKVGTQWRKADEIDIMELQLMQEQNIFKLREAV